MRHFRQYCLLILATGLSGCDFLQKEQDQEVTNSTSELNEEALQARRESALLLFEEMTPTDIQIEYGLEFYESVIDYCDGPPWGAEIDSELMSFAARLDSIQDIYLFLLAAPGPSDADSASTDRTIGRRPELNSWLDDVWENNQVSVRYDGFSQDARGVYEFTNDLAEELFGHSIQDDGMSERDWNRLNYYIMITYPSICSCRQDQINNILDELADAIYSVDSEYTFADFYFQDTELLSMRAAVGDRFSLGEEDWHDVTDIYYVVATTQRSIDQAANFLDIDDYDILGAAATIYGTQGYYPGAFESDGRFAYIRLARAIAPYSE